MEADYVVGDVDLCLGMIGILALPDTLHFEVQEEALSYRIIPIAGPKKTGPCGPVLSAYILNAYILTVSATSENSLSLSKFM